MSFDALAFDASAFTSVVRAAPDGLEALAWLERAAKDAPEPGRVLLSQAASSLVTRGWLPALDSLIALASEHGGVSKGDVEAAVPTLINLGLLGVEAGKVITFAGAFSTRPTGLRYVIDAEHEVHLLGPLAMLGVARGLSRSGRVVGNCAHEPSARLAFGCDVKGIFEREPDTAAMFLPAWRGDAAPVEAIAAGALFRDDDGLAAYQGSHDPAGMPVVSFLFPAATNDLGPRVGVALESLLDRLANFA